MVLISELVYLVSHLVKQSVSQSSHLTDTFHLNSCCDAHLEVVFVWQTNINSIFLFGVTLKVGLLVVPMIPISVLQQVHVERW